MGLPLWIRLLLVGGAGAVGAICRYLIMVYVKTTGAPIGLDTLIINSLACFLIGVFAGWLVVSPWTAEWKTAFSLLTMTGFCGGFSTFSAFTLDCVKYEEGHVFTWVIFATLTIFIGLFGCAIGYWLGQKL